MSNPESSRTRNRKFRKSRTLNAVGFYGQKKPLCQGRRNQDLESPTADKWSLIPRCEQMIHLPGMQVLRKLISVLYFVHWIIKKKTEINFSVIHYLNRIRLTQTNPNILLPPHAQDMQRNMERFMELLMYLDLYHFGHLSKRSITCQKKIT